MKKDRIIVALPAYNEEDSIGELMDRFKKLMDTQADMDISVLVINDGSQDRTVEILEEKRRGMPLEIIHHDGNQGLGAAVRTCLRSALEATQSDNDIIICMDADNTHLPRYIPGMVEKLRAGFDLVIASRFRPGSRQVGVPFLRKIYSLGARILFSIFLGIPGVRDYTCGYRAYHASLIRRALDRFGDDIIERNGFACTDDLLVNLAALTDKITEVPFVLRYDQKIGESKLPLMVTIMETLRLLMRGRRK